MSAQTKKSRSAMKHAGFSSTTILPGENAREFEELRIGLIAELSPDGTLEDEIVASLAHLLWRKKNLAIFGILENARQRASQIRDRLLPGLSDRPLESDGTADFEETFKKKWQAAESQWREEFGEEICDLVDTGADATLDGLAKHLAVQQRLDAMIDGCIRRLLMVKGVKTLTSKPNPVGRQRLS